jgi:hypothetical protein
MALQANALTLADHAKRLDPDGKTPHIVEMLSKNNQVLDDMVYMEGNLPTGTRTTIRTGLPTVAWRLLNQGVQPSKSTTAQVDEQCGMLEAWSEVDVEVARLNGNTASFRLSEAQSFIEAMSQEKAETLFYGNSSLDPEEFTGLSPRYSSLTGADNSQNVIDGGGAGADNSSIWLIVWGERSVHGIYPKGSTAGLDHKDLGETTIQDANGIAGARLRAYQDYFTWKCGLNLKDWRYAVRIANIDISDLVSGAGADLVDLMIKAMHRIHNLDAGKAAFYMNRTCIQMLDIQRYGQVKAAGLTYHDIDGKLVPHFRGVPIRTVDALVETEALVS